MTTMHGLALNVATNLEYDRFITPCGTPEFGITSVARELGRPVGLGEALEQLLIAASERFSIEFERRLYAK
jgi:lipoate-protein ligase B